MIGKFAEAFFRHKLLILLPPILIPLIVGPIALMTAPVYYETWTGVWVDRPSYAQGTGDWNNYISPAQNQMGQLQEQLRTRSFVLDIAKRTSLAPLIGSPAGEDRIATIINDGLTMFPSGSHLLVLRFRANTAALSFDLLNAVVDAFRDNASTTLVNQATMATSFYQSRLDTAQEAQQQSSEAIGQYLAANPRLAASAGQLAGSSALSLPPTATDPQLAQLLGNLQSAQRTVDQMRANLEQAQYSASASLDGQELGFQILDPPQVPTAPTRQTRQRIIYPVAGLVIGMVLSTVMLVLLVASDRSIRGEQELGNARVLGVVPLLNLKRIPRKARPFAMRRAVGFVAGAALPAPRGAK